MTKKLFNLNFLFPLFFIAFLIIASPVKGQDLCPPSFLEGIPLNGAVELYWDEPDRKVKTFVRRLSWKAFL